MASSKEKRPGGRTEALSKSFAGDARILPDPVDVLNGVHVVMVAFKVAGELRYRRRFYVNLNAAQRAVDRAVERGHAASITLCTLAPANGTGWAHGGAA